MLISSNGRRNRFLTFSYSWWSQAIQRLCHAENHDCHKQLFGLAQYFFISANWWRLRCRLNSCYKKYHQSEIRANFQRYPLADKLKCDLIGIWESINSGEEVSQTRNCIPHNNIIAIHSKLRVSGDAQLAGIRQPSATKYTLLWTQCLTLYLPLRWNISKAY